MDGYELPLEMGFDVDAKGTNKLEFDPILLDSGYDPIWDAIREEAKLEVFTHFLCCIIASCYDFESSCVNLRFQFSYLIIQNNCFVFVVVTVSIRV